MKIIHKPILYKLHAFLFFVAINLFLAQRGNAQDFLNTDFEYGLYQGQPRIWSIEGEGENYQARLDSTLSKNGNNSLFVSLKKAQVFIFLSLPAQLIAGKSIEIQAYIQSHNRDSLKLSLHFHNPSGGYATASQVTYTKSKEWQLISHKGSIAQDYSADRLLLALSASGSGNFWMDGVQIKINGKPYGNGKPDFREPTASEIQALNKRAIPIAINGDIRDLKPLYPLIKQVRIVALGENSHGSSSIFKLKLKLVKYLVEQEGFSIFALEAPMVESEKVNEYVVDGKGTIDSVLTHLTYPSWQTGEMVDIIEYMKSYNESQSKKVLFKGFDMQDGSSALKAVEDFAHKHDPYLLKK